MPANTPKASCFATQPKQKGEDGLTLKELEGDDTAGAAFETFTLSDYNPVSGTRKRRIISAPNAPMRLLHQRLIQRLRQIPCQMPFAVGARPGGSPRAALRPHLDARYIYTLDIKDAFPSVKRDVLAETLFRLDPDLGESPDEIAGFLDGYCFDARRGGLVIGAPASPDLFNIYVAELLDRRLADLIKRHGLRYTRYIDDLTFSSKTTPIGRRKSAALRRAVVAAGFSISDTKTRRIDLKKGPVVICGIGLEYGGRMFLPRHFLRKLKGLAHLAVKGKVASARVIGAMGCFWAASPNFALTLRFSQPNRTEWGLLKAVAPLRRQRGRKRPRYFKLPHQTYLDDPPLPRSVARRMLPPRR